MAHLANVVAYLDKPVCDSRRVDRNDAAFPTLKPTREAAGIIITSEWPEYPMHVDLARFIARPKNVLETY
jgi:hypothetical protein